MAFVVAIAGIILPANAIQKVNTMRNGENVKIQLKKLF